jgi:flagellar protein FliS
MQRIAQEEYMATEVMTATPQKLQLMVIEVALRASLQTKALWESQQNDAALAALLRSQAAVTAVLAHLNYDEKSPLVSRIAGIYLFIYKSLIMAQLKRDTAKLNDAIRVLEIERETWRQVCQQQSESGPREIKSPIPAPLSARMLSRADDLAGNSSFSLEA